MLRVGFLAFLPFAAVRKGVYRTENFPPDATVRVPPAHAAGKCTKTITFRNGSNVEIIKPSFENTDKPCRKTYKQILFIVNLFAINAVIRLFNDKYAEKKL